MRLISFERWSHTNLLRSLKILNRADRRKLGALILAQILFSTLDLVGVATIGVIGALAISGVQSQAPGNRVSSLLEFLQLNQLSLQFQVGILAIAAVTFLVSKTIFSIYFTRKSIFFMARKGAEMSTELITRLLSQSLTTMHSRSMSQVIYSITSGVTSVTVGVIATIVSVSADVAVLGLIGIGLLAVDPIIAICVFGLFGFIAFLLFKFMHERASRLGIAQAELGIVANERTFEVITSYREIVVQNRRNYYARMIGDQRKSLADVQAELAFMPNVSKYVMEIAMVIGAILLSAFQFLSQNAAHAVAVLSVFLAASTRIAPSLLRIQQGLVQIKSNLGSAAPTLDLIDLLKDAKGSEEISDEVDINHDGFDPSISASQMTFTYPDNENPVIDNFSIQINPGEVIALVGPSGAGKTTLLDLLLGVLDPDNGKVTISGKPPLKAFAEWPGAVSYVPQDIMISNGSYRENVCLGYPTETATDELVWDALKIAQLDEFVRSQPMNLDQPVGDRGSSISGGQRQRLGIARAMFTKPKMLFLDEATSALDGSTEAEIAESIQAMKGSVTVVMIAHRLSTVKNADRIYYLESGKIVASGDFESLRSKVPDFDFQARLMGL